MVLEGHETDRLMFRKVVPNDFDLWLPFYDDAESTRYWEGLPQDPTQACKAQFERIFQRYEEKKGGMNALIRKKDQALIGMCGLLLQHVDDQAEWEIGYSLLPDYRGQGFATEAARYCKEQAFSYGLADSLISIIHIGNVPSQMVALNNGMIKDFSTTYKNNPVYIYRVHRPD